MKVSNGGPTVYMSNIDLYQIVYCGIIIQLSKLLSLLDLYHGGRVVLRY